MQGLSDEIKEYVILRAPTTLREAYEAAMAKESAIQTIGQSKESSSIDKLVPVLSSLATNLAENKEAPQKNTLQFAKTEEKDDMYRLK